MKIHIVTGQTATGKTAQALHLAQSINGEIINFDSRQAYKKLDIVTGKDLEKGSPFTHTHSLRGNDIGWYSLQSTKIWLYDTVDPKESFSSYDFTRSALYAIKHLFREKKTPILVGGTYLYLYHLLYDIPQGNEPNWKLRAELESFDIGKLQKRLEKSSPELFGKMNNSDLHNPHRLIRKIELAESGQKTYASLPREEITLGKKLGIDQIEIEIIGYRYEDPAKLRATITQRVEKRLAAGAVDELKKLLKEGYTLHDPGLITIGYPQIKRFIDGEITEEQMKAEWITKEVKYAKRQYTFMKRDPNIKWTTI